MQSLSAGAGLVASAHLLSGLLTPDAQAQGGSAPAPGAPSANLGQTRQGDMIYRVLGRTGVRVSALGLGGHHIGLPETEQESLRLIHAAIDRGITFMDNCWDYHSGKSEVWMGKALKAGYRDKVFLMSKIDGRTQKAAAQQIDESLRRLQTDHIDLMQHHEILRFEDPDRIFGENGAHEAMIAAQKAGKIRFIGFTGHKDPQIHLRMLEIAKQHNFHFDSVQMPLNAFDAHFRSFGQQVLPVLVREGIAVLGMKPMASGDLLKANVIQPVECLHYALSLPTSVVITGIQNERDLNQAFEAAKTFHPLTEAEIAALLDKTKQAALTGKFELFKTSAKFDGTAHHPEWLG